MADGKFGHVDVPLKRIHIELTNVCDFNCAFCPKELMSRPYGYMDTGLAKRLIDEIAGHGLAEKVTFHVMGEPTLHKNFFEILDHAAAADMPVGLTTNGGRLGRPALEKLLDYPLHQVDVSLQTPDEASFALRKAGNLTFDEYLNNLFDFFVDYRARHQETIFKFRFLNTVFPVKSIEKRNGPIRVMSSTRELRRVFSYWVERIYAMVGEDAPDRTKALARINRLVSHRWNVVEVLPNLFFETYILSDWGHAFYDGPIVPAKSGFCDGMRNHFAILYNGDLTLCCIDFDGKTAIGNVNRSSLADILGSPALGRIMEGFKKNELVHPYCRHCLGSKNRLAGLIKPAVSILALNVLRPYFYRQIKLFDES